MPKQTPDATRPIQEDTCSTPVPPAIVIPNHIGCQIWVSRDKLPKIPPDLVGKTQMPPLVLPPKPSELPESTLRELRRPTGLAPGTHLLPAAASTVNYEENSGDKPTRALRVEGHTKTHVALLSS